MSKKITYKDKEGIYNDVDIPETSKFTDANANEIKNVINAHANEIEALQKEQGSADEDIKSLLDKVKTLETDNTVNKTNISNLTKNKVDKEKGKGLSTNDFTTELKNKLEGLENYDDSEIKVEQKKQSESISALLDNQIPRASQRKRRRKYTYRRLFCNTC